MCRMELAQMVSVHAVAPALQYKNWSLKEGTGDRLLPLSTTADLGRK
jgi:hypothetical protein